MRITLFIILMAFAWALLRSSHVGAQEFTPHKSESRQLTEEHDAIDTSVGDVGDHRTMDTGCGPNSLTLAKPLFASGLVSANTEDHAVKVDVDVTGAEKLYLVVTDAGDGIRCDFANWANARLTTDKGNIDLRQVEWGEARTSWGEVRIDVNAEGQPMRINGRRVRGIGTHANSLIEYDLPRGSTRFQALAGLDSQGTDEGCGSTVKFAVYTEEPNIEIERLARDDSDEETGDDDVASVRKFEVGRSFDAGRDRTNRATPVANLRLPEGFQAELLYTVPLDKQGSWVCLTVDPKGRLVASDQLSGLYRITLPSIDRSMENPQVERLDVDIEGAQGLLFAHDSLYAVANGERSGLYRLRDSNGDDQFDRVELLRQFDAGGEHGPHAVVLGPDQVSLYIVGGNSCFLSTPPERSRVPRVWQEDRLLTRTNATDGPWNVKDRIGGWICRTDPEGRKFELYAMGFRNPYDLAFNRDGELFTFDADMEWDTGTPWYRPTRINHVISGGDYGWRAGSAKWPDTYFDSFGSVVDVGLSSPTGIAFGYDANFPSRYRDALLVADWSLGNIYAVHLHEDGASYQGEFEALVTGAPLPVTDLVIHPMDGAMYFSVGGRGITSAVYCVTYVGGNDERTPAGQSLPAEKPATPAAVPSAARATRRHLESLHTSHAKTRLDDIWPYLSDSNRAIRYAARVALEHVPVEDWLELAKRENKARTMIAVSLAYARQGETDGLSDIIRRLDRIQWQTLTQPDQNDLLRSYTVLLNRFGREGETGHELRRRVRHRLNDLFPTGIGQLDQQLAEILVFVDAPPAIDRVLDQLESVSTQEEQIHYVMCLRDVEDGWNLVQRRRLFHWFQRTAAQRGGVLFGDYMEQIRAAIVDQLSEHERNSLGELLKFPVQTDPYGELKSREIVAEWKVNDLYEIESRIDHGDAQRGRAIFATALCFRCHRFNGQGGMVGPDLTNVGRRFNVADLVESIVEPSRVISDQYRAVQIVTDDGRVVMGKVTDLNGNTLFVMNDALNPSDITMVRRDVIDELNWSPTSTMPTGLLDTFTRHEIVDLIVFLRN